MLIIGTAHAQDVEFDDDFYPADPNSIDIHTDIRIGNTSSGSLTIANGGQLDNAVGFIGYDTNGVGVVTVSGAGSQWNNASDLVVGQSGQGRLDILDGGFVSASSSYVGVERLGIVNIAGTDGAGTSSTLSLRDHLLIGETGDATVTVGQGGRLQTGGQIYVDSTGEAKIVVNGGIVQSGNAILGINAGYSSEGVLSAGGIWTGADQFTVGLAGEGILRIEDGATLTSNQGYVGAESGGQGSVTVTGAGSSWEMTGSNLSLGNNGSGQMTIADGGRVFALRGVDLGSSDAAATGTLTVLGTPGARGVIETNFLRGGQGTAAIILDGGMIRAIAHTNNFIADFEGQTFTLGAAGGVIDTDVFNIGIAPELAGPGELIKAGAGRLTLTGTSSYSGGTTIEAGTLQLGNGGTRGSILGNVVTHGMLAFNRSDDVVFAGTLSGNGGVNQRGTGMTTLSADSPTLLGTSRVSDGILSVNGILGGAIDVVGGRLQGIGQVGTTNFTGGIIAPGNSIGTLTINGDYHGAGGTLEIETELGSDASATDRLIITGDSTGSTNVRVLNVGGGGAPTAEGIRIIEVGGMSDGDFVLLGNSVFNGDQAVVAGAYAYRLYQGGASTPLDGHWYLRSSRVAPVNPGGPNPPQPPDPDPPEPVEPVDPGDPVGPTDPVDPVDPVVPIDPVIPVDPVDPIYQPGAPIYETYAVILQSFNRLETLRQRVGNRAASGGVLDIGSAPHGAGPQSGLWWRVSAQHADMRPQASTTQSTHKSDMRHIEFGGEAIIDIDAAGSFVAGLSGRFGSAKGTVFSPFGNGTIDTSGYGIGGSLTWYGAEGLYVDAQARLSVYDSQLSSLSAQTSLVSGNRGFGYATGVEIGQQVELGSGFSLTPQGQLSYSEVFFDGFTDVFGATVSLLENKSLRGRLGLAIDYEQSWMDEHGTAQILQAYGIGNLYYDLLPSAAIAISGIHLNQTQDAFWGGLGLGGRYSWNDGKYAINGEASLKTNLSAAARSHELSANAGLQVRF